MHVMAGRSAIYLKAQADGGYLLQCYDQLGTLEAMQVETLRGRNRRPAPCLVTYGKDAVQQVPLLASTARSFRASEN